MSFWYNVDTGQVETDENRSRGEQVLGPYATEEEARGALRITLGHTSTAADVDAFVAALPDAVARAGAAGMASRAPLLGR